MKLDKNFAAQVYISTEGMEPFDILKHQQAVQSTGLYDKLKSTQCYRDKGQLHQGSNEPTGYAFFIQREDGEVFLGSCRGVVYYESIKEYLDPEIQAELILCEVPAHQVSYYGKRYLDVKYGTFEFLAQHHPSHEVRVRMSAMLWEIAHAEENPSLAH